MKDAYVVAFYRIDREYGGPEEGGWYYDSGSLIRVSRVTFDEAEAMRIVARANDLLRFLQRHKRPVGSVVYAGDRYQARVYRNNAPDYYPQETPYYE